MAFIFVQKQKEISRNSQKKKKMTGFQQRAWLSNDKKERKTVQWDEISIQLAFLHFNFKQSSIFLNICKGDCESEV